MFLLALSREFPGPKDTEAVLHTLLPTMAIGRLKINKILILIPSNQYDNRFRQVFDANQKWLNQ
jgi:hypothetical protein